MRFGLDTWSPRRPVWVGEVRTTAYLVAISGLLIGLPATQAGDGTAKDLFATEYPQRRAEVAAHPKQRPQYVESETTEREDGEVVSAGRFVMRRMDNSFLVSYERLPSVPPPVQGNDGTLQYCCGYNGLYYFELKKKETGTWALSNLAMPPPDYTDLHKLISISGVSSLVFPKSQPKDDRLPAKAIFSPMRDNFNDLPRSPGYKFLSAQSVDAESKLVRVEYLSDYNDVWVYQPTQAQCSITFDRTRHWAVTAASKRIAVHGLEWDYRAEYQPDTDFPVLAKAVTTIGSKHPGRKRSEMTTVKTTRFEGERLDAISLSAFGLPEPPGVVWEKPTPTYVWLLSVAGVMAAVGVLVGGLTRWRRRSRSISAA